MRASLRWLSELVDIDVSTDKLVELLNFSGTKVEAVHAIGAEVSGVVVAEVAAVTEHPHADNLSLVEVRGADGFHRVVCGASNFAVGDRVPFAEVGARLPGMTIGARKIRGEPSEGMLCSAAELQISDDHSGILILPPEAELGDDIVSLLGLDGDLLELEITPNRPDCMGMVGLAREVAALLGRELKWPPEPEPGDASLTPAVTVEIADPQGCPRYVARYLDEMAIAPSPLWLASRLVAHGMRPISNVVDVTNYVLLETGQPLHAFDAATIAERKVIVRRAGEGETLVTLDGAERRLESSDLVIADPSGAIGLAGVMGGAATEVSESTTAVVLESACFERSSVARTGRRLFLRTEASVRFERGSDPEMAPVAAARAAALMARLAGGRAAAEAVDAQPRPFEPRRATLRPSRTDHLLGIEVASEVQRKHLRSLGFGVSSSASGLEVSIPSWRQDVANEVDLIEEVGRLEGFDRLPATLPAGVRGGLEPEQAALRALARSLSACGLHEAWTPTFMSAGALDDLGVSRDDIARATVQLINPMNEDERRLRTTLLPGLLRSCARNLAHGAPGVALFELARVYRPGTGALVDEPGTLAAVLSGRRSAATWRHKETPWDFFAVKGVLDAALRSLRLGPLTYAASGGMPWHPTRVAAVSIGDAGIGVVGELHPEVCERFEVAGQSLAFELDLTRLLAALPERPKVAELPRFPPIYMDLAFVVDSAVPQAALRRAIEEAGRPEVTSVVLFDLYEGEQVPAGGKSLAYALELRSRDRTLTDEEAAAVRARIVSAVAERTGGELRS
ncbi:MAG: phenylalanine--tRNA ligase subunit beta [Actinomycetota bacterium]|nr:phenylalanine--tRNA ligase subunit beta [Actinomycetota bacterium]